MARLNKKAPQTVTYQGLSYELVERKATAPVTVTFKGAQYKRICAEQLPTPHPWVDDRGKGTRKDTSTPFSLDDEYMPSPVVEDIYVRMSQSDYRLLVSLPQAVEGHLQGLLQRMQSKKLNSGRAEVLASEAEVKAAIAALEEFVQSEDDENPDVVHAQDMLSTWKRNYIIPDKSLSKPLPTYKSELPPSSNIRMFHYKGARYVLVRADEQDPQERLLEEYQKENEFFADELFNKYISKVSRAVQDATPLGETRKQIDTLVSAVTAMRQSVEKPGGANWEGKFEDGSAGMRKLTDILYKGHEKDLVYVLNTPGAIDDMIAKYVSSLNEFKSNLDAANMHYKAALDHAVQKGWTSKWAATREASKLRKEILSKFYGVKDPDNFIKDFYHVPKNRPEKVPGKGPEQTEASVKTAPRTIRFKGVPYVLQG
jgi:hypothetical protein